MPNPFNRVFFHLALDNVVIIDPAVRHDDFQMNRTGFRIELRVFEIEWIVTCCDTAGQDFPVPVQCQAYLSLIGRSRSVIAEPDPIDTL